MNTISMDVMAAIQSAAVQNSLDINLLKAICNQESAFLSCRTRFEPVAYARGSYLLNAQAYASRLGVTSQTEGVQQYTSWGLMQIMGFSARELGFEGYFPELCIPSIGLLYGCKKLRKLFDRYGDEEDVISAYNQGSPRKTPGGLYENQKPYVDPVCATLRELRGLVP